MTVIPVAPIGFRLAHELEGLLAGIVSDHVIDEAERERLHAWLVANHPYASIRPFSELAERVDSALEDGRLTLEECQDLLFVTTKYTTVNPHFDQLRGGLQVLMGTLAGIAADGIANELEVRELQAWLEQSAHLSGLWPYEECASLVTSICAGVQPRDCAAALIGLAAQFPVAGHQASGGGAAPPLLVGGICAVDPAITFHAMQFVFTGESRRAPRHVMVDQVERRGGVASDRVTQEIDYLIVCDAGSPLWAYSCYGRKVEYAYKLRREGHHVLIVHETDFWAAVRET